MKASRSTCATSSCRGPTIITPNHFELDFLAGRATTTLDEVLAAVDVVRATGPRHVLVTSVVHGDAAAGTVDVVAVSDEGRLGGDHARCCRSTRTAAAT